MGIPVVGFQGPGIEVLNGETGLLAPERDEGALAEAMVTLLQDEVLAAQMGAAGRQRMERLFNLRRQTALLEEKYDEVLNSTDFKQSISCSWDGRWAAANTEHL
jgi:colanic acid/amylovoran biosynthesis glycosyltransferase